MSALVVNIHMHHQVLEDKPTILRTIKALHARTHTRKNAQQYTSSKFPAIHMKQHRYECANIEHIWYKRSIQNLQSKSDSQAWWKVIFIRTDESSLEYA
jgi:hypothetical protein